jgi:hypothetical protein
MAKRKGTFTPPKGPLSSGGGTVSPRQYTPPPVHSVVTTTPRGARPTGSVSRPAPGQAKAIKMPSTPVRMPTLRQEGQKPKPGRGQARKK